METHRFAATRPCGLLVSSPLVTTFTLSSSPACRVRNAWCAWVRRNLSALPNTQDGARFWRHTRSKNPMRRSCRLLAARRNAMPDLTVEQFQTLSRQIYQKLGLHFDEKKIYFQIGRAHVCPP